MIEDEETLLDHALAIPKLASDTNSQNIDTTEIGWPDSTMQKPSAFGGKLRSITVQHHQK
jgi:hypothetical protein